MKGKLVLPFFVAALIAGAWITVSVLAEELPRVRKLEIGSKKFAIPTEYIVPPLETTGQDGDYAIVRSIYVVGLAPDFAARSAANEREFHLPLCCLSALVTPLTKLDRSAVMPSLIDRWFRWFRIVSTERIGRFTHYSVEAPTRMIILSRFGDVYVRDDRQEAIQCNRTDREDGRHIVNVTCHDFYIDDAGAWQISIPDNRGEENYRLFDLVKAKTETWMKRG